MAFFIGFLLGCMGSNEFYSFIESEGVKIQRFETKGLGVVLQKNVSENEAIFCVSRSISLHSNEENYIQEYLKGLPEKEKLKAILLYHKFMLSYQSPHREYINTLNPPISHPLFYSSTLKDLLKSVSLYPEATNYSLLKSSHKILNNLLYKIKDINPKLLGFDEYLWATAIVNSRSLLIFEEGQHIYVLIPYIDLVNHWPNANSQGSIKYLSGKYCLIADHDLIHGDEIFIDYLNYDVGSFFWNYGFTSFSNKLNSVMFIYSRDPCRECKYELTSGNLNNTMINVILSQIGSKYKASSNHIVDLKKLLYNKELQNYIVAMFIYRIELKGMISSSKNIGLRQLRRHLLKETDFEKKAVIFYGVAQREILFSHLKTLEKSIIISLWQLLFK